MHKFISLLTTALTLCVFMVGCGAPSNNENGIVNKHDISDRPKPIIKKGSHDIIYRVKTRGIGTSLAKAFNDVNDLQLSAAQAIGIDPIHTLSDAYNTTKPLKKIEGCEDFYLDTLTHSMPYLVPQAADLLHDIGKAFSDTIMARNGHRCRIRVTSVLRTDNSIKSLRRRNRNATDASCHRFGTTFDISWRRFYHDDPDYIMYTEDLKNILGEILFKMREEGRCYVKYERKQSCFHITAR